jgi:glycosyltransferase involved in cell wall biosynthesis
MLCFVLRGRFRARSVLHISAMIHVPWQTTRLLREQGWHADYLAIGRSPIWDQADFCRQSKPTWWDALDEFLWIWRLVSRYEVVHLHFMITATRSGWELYWLRRMGRKIVVHWRGCEIRNRERNMALHPDVNLCQECDYNPYACELDINVRRRQLARRFGNVFLVTTPDLLDFEPTATHLPFFSPDKTPPSKRVRRPDQPFKLVHVTVHPGLEATNTIRATVDRLRSRGYRIEFVALSWVKPHEVLEAFAGADMAIGKMRMGYYANAQIESMAMGVPTITFVRPEFMNDELRASGFIFCSLEELESTLAYYLEHPEVLEERRTRARSSILRLHDNRKVAARLAQIYDGLS